MFGRKKASSVTKPKRRWFFKVENIADAEEAIKICYQTFYALAAIQAVIFSFLYIMSDVSVLSYFDPILMLILAWFIDHKKSRTAAVMLGMYAVPIAVITLGNRLGVNLTDGLGGGKNIVLSALALYGMYKGLQGTFKYHDLVEDEVIVKNVWKMTGLLFLYNIVALGILLSVSLTVLILGQGLFGPDQFSDEAVGGMLFLCIFFASAGTAFRILPWTKNKPLIAVKNSDAH